jgi:hypothetical protein
VLSLSRSIEEAIGVNTLRLLFKLGMTQNVGHVVVTMLPDEGHNGPIVLLKRLASDDTPVRALDIGDCRPSIEI